MKLLAGFNVVAVGGGFQRRAQRALIQWHCFFLHLHCRSFSFGLTAIDLERYCRRFHAQHGGGRTGVTFAEISFACQIALILHEAGGMANLPWVQALFVPIVAALTLAQVFVGPV